VNIAKLPELLRRKDRPQDVRRTGAGQRWARHFEPHPGESERAPAGGPCP